MRNNHSLPFLSFILVLLVSLNSKAAPLTLTLTVTNTCYNSYDGSITANVSGGTPPYTYLWSNGATTATISGLAVSYYQVDVTDAASNITKDGVNLTAPEPPTATYSSTDPAGYHTFDGTIAVSVSGGATPYSYLWADGPSWQNRNGLGGGSYQFMVTDNNGCSTDQITVYLTEPPRDDWSLAGSSGTNPSSNFIGTTDNKDMVFRTNNAERLRLGNSGDVKINSLSGNAGMLYVDGNGLLRNGTTTVTAPCNGSIIPTWQGLSTPLTLFTCPQINVGIGTYSPATNFHVIGNSVFTATSGSINSAAMIQGANSSSAPYPEYTWWNNPNTGLFHPATNVIGFSTNGSEKMRIDGNGDLKISSLASSGNSIVMSNNSGVLNKILYTSATDVLLGNGTFGPVPSSGGASYWNLSSGNLSCTNPGNVGIGTSPSEKLEVSGIFGVIDHHFSEQIDHRFSDAILIHV